MYSINEYNNLVSKYGSFASWAIWNYEDSKDTSIIDKNLDQLHSRYVLLGLNMSRLLNRPAWFNFHDNTHSRKVRYACNDNELRGSYMTDLFKDMIDPSSSNFEKNVTKKDIDANIKLFNQEMVDVKINEDTKFIIFGQSTFRFFNQYFKQDYGNEVISIPHYSSRGTDKEWVEGFWKKLNINLNFESIVNKYIKIDHL